MKTREQARREHVTRQLDTIIKYGPDIYMWSPTLCLIEQGIAILNEGLPSEKDLKAPKIQFCAGRIPPVPAPPAVR